MAMAVSGHGGRQDYWGMRLRKWETCSLERLFIIDMKHPQIMERIVLERILVCKEPGSLFKIFYKKWDTEKKSFLVFWLLGKELQIFVFLRDVYVCTAYSTGQVFSANIFNILQGLSMSLLGKVLSNLPRWLHLCDGTSWPPETQLFTFSHPLLKEEISC
jgi:hypothetical protein